MQHETLIFASPLEIVLIVNAVEGEGGPKCKWWMHLLTYDKKINAMCNFWPQLQILGGQLTPWPGLPSPCFPLNKYIYRALGGIF